MLFIVGAYQLWDVPSELLYADGAGSIPKRSNRKFVDCKAAVSGCANVQVVACCTRPPTPTTFFIVPASNYP